MEHYQYSIIVEMYITHILTLAGDFYGISKLLVVNTFLARGILR